MPSHTPHKHGLEGHVCAGVFSWPSCLETFCCSPVKWNIPIDIAYCCCHIVLKNIGELDHIGGFLSHRELSYTYLVRTGNCSGNIISWLARLNSGIKTLTRLGCLKGNPGMLKLSRLNVCWNYLGYILLTQKKLKR